MSATTQPNQAASKRKDPPENPAPAPRWGLSRLSLTDFRNYRSLTLALEPGLVVLIGANGAGKTNILEAISLLSPGSGLRNALLSDFARAGGPGGWAVAARLVSNGQSLDIGTGQMARTPDQPPQDALPKRTLRIAGETVKSTAALAQHLELLWLTPAYDQLFMGPAADRRRFLDRLVLAFDPLARSRWTMFERAMRHRNRLLEDGVREGGRFAGLERQMAETGVALAAQRRDTIDALSAVIARRSQSPEADPFPTAGLALSGTLERELETAAAIDVEDAYADRLARSRDRDRAAGRTLEGPHRTDLVVSHVEKGMPAAQSSTGEQKALLMGLVLAHAELLARRDGGRPPILLIDEVAAHLDPLRRAALFARLSDLGCQTFLTGTEMSPFESLLGRAQVLRIDGGRAELQPPPVKHP